MLRKSLQAVVQKMNGLLVHVEYPMPVMMGAKKEGMSELHELPCLAINLLCCTHCLVGSLAINKLVLLHEMPDCSETSFNALGAKGGAATMPLGR